MELEKKESKLYTYTSHIAIFAMLYLTGGFAVGYMLGGTMQLLIQVAVIGIVMFSMMLSTKKLYLNPKTLIFIIILISLILIGDWWRGETQKQTRISIISFSFAYLFSLCYDFKGYAKKYTNVMQFLCVCSLILWGTYVIAPGLVQKLPSTINSAEVLAYNAFFASIYSWGGLARNQGIFWEPGAFQVFINLALLIDLFYLKNTTKKRLLIYLITIFTTFSTAGYVVTIFILYTYLMSFFINKETRNVKNVKTIFYIMTVLFILIFIFSLIDLPIVNNVFGKIERYLEYNNTNFTGEQQLSSTSVRVDAIIEPLKHIWNERKFMGIGVTHNKLFAYKMGYNMTTCTFVNFLAFYGAIFAFMIWHAYYKFSSILSKSFLIKLLIFVCIILVTVSEDLAKNVSFLVFAFLAISHNPNDEAKLATNKEQINEKNIRN